MAPEVAKGMGSLLISDVYSFGVLLWEICTLEKPYKHICSHDEFMESVVVEEWRHTTSKIPSVTLRKLIKLCWHTDARSRPQFSKIVKKLRVEVAMTKSSQIGGATAVPNKGFGSSVNLKRTATWTAKKLSSGISQSTLGVVRMGFRNSKESLEDGPAEPSTPPSQFRIGRMRNRSKSPGKLKNPLADGPGDSNAVFATTSRRSRNQDLNQGESSMVGIPELGHKGMIDGDNGNEDSLGNNKNSTMKPRSLRRGLPSAPVIGH